jgi:protein-disulfide isomerase
MAMLKRIGTLTLGVVALAGALWLAALPQPGGGPVTLGQALLPNAAHADTTADATAPDKLPAVPDYSLGNPDAKVKVIEYGAFTCPHCAEFHADVWPKLKENYIDTGKIQFTFRAFFLQRYGLWADLIARCGGEMRYYGLIDMIFDKQREWYSSDASQTVANLRQIGLAAGLTKSELDQCLNDGPMAQALVAKFQKYAKQDEIEGTPTFMINGKKYQNMGYDDFAKILDGLLAK